MSQKKPDELFLKCSCGSEVLNLELDPYEGLYYVALYNIDKSDLSWIQRLRYSWKTIWTGKPFNDQMVLHYVDIEKLQDYLKTSEEYRVTFHKKRQEALVKLQTNTQTEKSP